MFLVLFLYLLLATPVTGLLAASVHSAEGEAVFGVRLAGVELLRAARFAAGEDGWPFSAQSKKGRAKKSGRRAGFPERLGEIVRKTAKLGEIDVCMRIGLGEAWSTALAAGGAKAALNAALSALGTKGPVRICVIPDFAAPVFCAQFRCIFFVTAGDIIFTAVKERIKRAA